MEAWIPITLLAAFSQNIRGALQKHLTGRLSVVGATQVRFLYAVPFAALYVGVLIIGFDYQLPSPGRTFFIYATIGGVAQTIAAAMLVALYKYRNFFVGTAYAKTETIQAAVLGYFVLSDELSVGAIVGICLGLIGVILLSGAKNHVSPGEIVRSLKTKTALVGVCAGLFFGVAAIGFRGASLSLTGGTAIQAAITLIYVLLLQTLILTIYLWRKQPGQMTAVLVNWRIAWMVGLAGMLASVGWFTAMTLQNAGYVRALGQIELIFAFAASALIFKEQTNKAEYASIAIIVFGILVLLVGR